MSWKKTGSKANRKTNINSEMLLDVHENLRKSGEYWIYNLTSYFPSAESLDRRKWMNQVSHSIMGGNKVTIHIICKDGSLSPARAEKLAKDFYNGDTYTNRLD